MGAPAHRLPSERPAIRAPPVRCPAHRQHAKIRAFAGASLRGIQLLDDAGCACSGRSPKITRLLPDSLFRQPRNCCGTQDRIFNIQAILGLSVSPLASTPHLADLRGQRGRVNCFPTPRPSPPPRNPARSATPRKPLTPRDVCSRRSRGCADNSEQTRGCGVGLCVLS